MVLLQDLLGGENFSQSVNDLAADFRRTYSLPGIRQLGLVVPYVESAARALEARGIGPFAILGGSPLIWLERGENRNVSGTMGLAYHEGIELELLQPMEGSDFYKQSLDPKGRPVVQHAGFFVEDVDRWAESLVAAGMPVVVRGQLKNGPVLVQFAYLDTFKEAGLIVEFITLRIRGRPFVPPPGAVRGARWREKVLRRRPDQHHLKPHAA